MSDAGDLLGWPKKRLVKLVRSHLWRYGIRPKGEPWRLTWSWASAIARSYYHTHWPAPREIATQYLVLLLAEMEECCALRLPYRAAQQMPDQIRQLLNAAADRRLVPKKRRSSTEIDFVRLLEAAMSPSRGDGGLNDRVE